MWCTNNVQTSSEEKYKIKLDWYDARCKELRPTLTREMFIYASADLTGAQRIGSGLLWRT
jgi:hypothetical protein